MTMRLSGLIDALQRIASAWPEIDPEVDLLASERGQGGALAVHTESTDPSDLDYPSIKVVITNTKDFD